MGRVLPFPDADRLRERRIIERLAKQLESSDAYVFESTKPHNHGATMKRILLSIMLWMPLLAFGANFSASLSTYDTRSTGWSLNCAVGTATKTLAGSAAIGSPITFTLGSPGDDVACVAFTTKGVDSSPFSSEVTVHIPLVLTAPVLQMGLQP